MVRGCGSRPYSHQQFNKASAALWFEPQRCKSRNAHLRDFLEQQFHSFFDKLAGVAAGRPAAQELARRSQTNKRKERLALHGARGQSLYSSHQDQNNNDDQDDAEPTAGIITPAA